jgi:mannose-6-phosphate isomerase-like protein (cupin superfamily)
MSQDLGNGYWQGRSGMLVSDRRDGMSDHTKINLNDVEDSAPKFGYEELMEVRFAQGDLNAEQAGVSHHKVKPGKRQGFGHKHDDAEEIYIVIGGSGRVKLDDEIVELERLDAVRVAPAVTRQFEAGDEGLEYIVFGASHEGDGELVQDWWTD